jgi:hypothetical protein
MKSEQIQYSKYVKGKLKTFKESVSTDNVNQCIQQFKNQGLQNVKHIKTIKEY